MGFLHAGVCYATYDEAMSVKFGADAVLITTATSGTDKIHFFENIAGLWYWSEYTTTGGVWTLAYNSPMAMVNFASCVPSGQTFDYALASSFWVFAFSFTVGCWYLAKNLGLILQAVKRW